MTIEVYCCTYILSSQCIINKIITLRDKWGLWKYEKTVFKNIYT